MDDINTLRARVQDETADAVETLAKTRQSVIRLRQLISEVESIGDRDEAVRREALNTLLKGYENLDHKVQDAEQYVMTIFTLATGILRRDQDRLIHEAE